MPERINPVERTPLWTWAKQGEELLKRRETKLDSLICWVMLFAQPATTLGLVVAVPCRQLIGIILDALTLGRVRLIQKAGLVPARLAEKLSPISLGLLDHIIASEPRLLAAGANHFDLGVRHMHLLFLGET